MIQTQGPHRDFFHWTLNAILVYLDMKKSEVIVNQNFHRRSKELAGTLKNTALKGVRIKFSVVIQILEALQGNFAERMKNGEKSKIKAVPKDKQFRISIGDIVTDLYKLKLEYKIVRDKRVLKPECKIELDRRVKSVQRLLIKISQFMPPAYQIIPEAPKEWLQGFNDLNKPLYNALYNLLFDENKKERELGFIIFILINKRFPTGGDKKKFPIYWSGVPTGQL